MTIVALPCAKGHVDVNRDTTIVIIFRGNHRVDDLPIVRIGIDDTTPFPTVFVAEVGFFFLFAIMF